MAADRIVIEGSRRYDGEYELDLAEEPFTTLEWRWIKKISGYLPLTLIDGWTGGDPDVFLALGVIAMRRFGKIDKDEALVVAEKLEDGATISFVGAHEEGDAADPPAVAPEQPPRSSGTSGERSSLTSDPPGQTQSPTGRESDRSATSDPATLVI